jgi:hypothetical protein
MMEGRSGKAALIGLFSAIGAFGAGGVEAMSDKTYQLQLTGDEGARFVGSCTLTTADGETVLPLDGEVPYANELVGQGFACKLETQGRVVVDIEHNGSRSRSSTNGGVVNISLK